ncbi:MAG: hypothetical protein ACI3XJ_12695 [Oscillospiraceae bacterium]
MYIKMNNDKSLLITVPTTIYRGEGNADLITFLLPTKYEGIDIEGCSVAMRYILPSGMGGSDALARIPEMYKGYLQYSTTVNPGFTSEEGVVTVWLTIFSSDGNAVFKTSKVLIPIEPSQDITESLPDEDLDQLDQLAAQIADLDRRKADNIVLNDEDNTIQLLANDDEIGDRIQLDSDSVWESI